MQELLEAALSVVLYSRCCGEAQIEIISKGRSLMNVQTALSQNADYRVTMEFNPLTLPAI